LRDLDAEIAAIDPGGPELQARDLGRSGQASLCVVDKDLASGLDVGPYCLSDLIGFAGAERMGA
jgi:hypothetical protein